MATYEFAKHVMGCPCGYGDEYITPIDYLEKCILVRMKAHKGIGEFNHHIPINEKTLGEELSNSWREIGVEIQSIGSRAPLLCPQGFPTGPNLNDGFADHTRTAFFNFAIVGYGAQGQNRYNRIERDFHDGVDVKENLYFSHWTRELELCPCERQPQYLQHVWGDDDEDFGRKDAIRIDFIERQAKLTQGVTVTSEQNLRKRTFARGSFDMNSEFCELWLEEPRVEGSDKIYELHHLFNGVCHSEQAIPHQKRFVLSIPYSPTNIYEQVKDFLLPRKDKGEIRAWGGNDHHVHEDDKDNEFLIIRGTYNATATRVFNDLDNKQGGRGGFSTKGGYHLEVVGEDGEHLVQDGGVINLNSHDREFSLLITKRRGEVLQKLYFFRMRIFSDSIIPRSNLENSSFINNSEIREIEGGVEFMVSAKEQYLIQMNFSDFTQDEMSIDIQELESVAGKRELSHTSLQFKRIGF